MYKLIVGIDHPIVTKSCRRCVRIPYFLFQITFKLIGAFFYRIRYHIDMNKEIGASLALVPKDSYVDYINSTVFNTSAI